MVACKNRSVNDPLLAARRIPRLAELAIRDAVVRALEGGRMTPRALVDAALLRFQTAASRYAHDVRPALLFTERDRIVRELRTFVDGRLAARLGALRRDRIIAAGRAAAPFDAIVRDRRGRAIAVLIRRLPADGRRLDLLQRVRAAMQQTRTPVDGVLIYDLVRGRVALVLDEAGADRVHRYLRAG
jgi:hypothetical protein